MATSRFLTESRPYYYANSENSLQKPLLPARNGRFHLGYAQGNNSYISFAYQIDCVIMILARIHTNRPLTVTCCVRKPVCTQNDPGEFRELIQHRKNRAYDLVHYPLPCHSTANYY